MGTPDAVLESGPGAAAAAAAAAGASAGSAGPGPSTTSPAGPTSASGSTSTSASLSRHSRGTSLVNSTQDIRQIHNAYTQSTIPHHITTSSHASGSSSTTHTTETPGGSRANSFSTQVTSPLSASTPIKRWSGHHAELQDEEDEDDRPKYPWSVYETISSRPLSSPESSLPERVYNWVSRRVKLQQGGMYAGSRWRNVERERERERLTGGYTRRKASSGFSSPHGFDVWPYIPTRLKSIVGVVWW